MARLDQQRGTVHIAYQTYNLHADEVFDPPEDLEEVPANGLATAAPDYLRVTTGVHTGDVLLTVETWSQEPPPQLEPWDDVVELPFHSTTGDARIVDEWTDTPPAIDVNIAFAGPGQYRLRVHARGRDAGYEADVVSADAGDELVEEHLIQIWAAPAAPEMVLKTTDRLGHDIRTGQF